MESKAENLRVLPPVPQDPVVSLAANSRLLLSWSDNVVKIWQVDNINESNAEKEPRIEKRYLLQMAFNVISSK